MGDHLGGRLHRHADHTNRLSFSDLARLTEEIDEDGLHIKAYSDQNLPYDQAIDLGYHGEGMINCFPIQHHPRYVVRPDCKKVPKSMLFVEHGVFD